MYNIYCPQIIVKENIKKYTLRIKSLTENDLKTPIKVTPRDPIYNLINKTTYST